MGKHWENLFSLTVITYAELPQGPRATTHQIKENQGKAQPPKVFKFFLEQRDDPTQICKREALKASSVLVFVVVVRISLFVSLENGRLDQWGGRMGFSIWTLELAILNLIYLELNVIWPERFALGEISSGDAFLRAAVNIFRSRASWTPGAPSFFLCEGCLCNPGGGPWRRRAPFRDYAKGRDSRLGAIVRLPFRLRPGPRRGGPGRRRRGRNRSSRGAPPSPSGRLCSRDWGVGRVALGKENASS